MLTVDGQESSATLTIEPDPAYPHLEFTTELLEAVEAQRRASEAEEDDDEEEESEMHSEGDRPVDDD